VVDNGSDQTDSLNWLHALPKHPAAQVLESCQVLRIPGAFNYSHLNNAAAKSAQGELLCFLNNDIEIIQPDWLTVMNHLAQIESHGCIGATLLYPDNTIQHAGVVVGVETIAGHIYKNSPSDARGHNDYLLQVQEVDAVTGAALVLRRTLFESLGGFDEALPVAFNDVDLCLRSAAAGCPNYWTPNARLRHHESKSRGVKGSRTLKQKWIHRKAIQHMRKRWPEALQGKASSMQQWHDAQNWQH